VAKWVIILPTAHSQERMTMKIQTWYPNRISKMLTKKEKQAKKKDNMEVDDESLDMIFKKN
jgi:hypothetical protein